MNLKSFIHHLFVVSLMLLIGSCSSNNSSSVAEETDTVNESRIDTLLLAKSYESDSLSSDQITESQEEVVHNDRIPAAKAATKKGFSKNRENGGIDESAIETDTTDINIAENNAPVNEMFDSTESDFVDTGNIVAIPSDKPLNIPIKIASLGYSYPTTLTQGETKDVNVFITISEKDSLVKKVLNNLVNEQKIGAEKRDSNMIQTLQLRLYKSLKITLSSTDIGIKIEKRHNSNLQIIDTINGNYWKWYVTANTNQTTAKLSLHVDVISLNDLEEPWLDKDINLNIQMNKRAFARSYENYIAENPKTFVSILISFLGFIGYLIKYRIEKKKSASSNV